MICDVCRGNTVLIKQTAVTIEDVPADPLIPGGSRKRQGTFVLPVGAWMKEGWYRLVGDDFAGNIFVEGDWYGEDSGTCVAFIVSD